MKNIYIDVDAPSGGGGTGQGGQWTRPADWLVLPTLVEGEQKVVGLHAVYGDSDFCAILCAGNYHVDWGDGTVVDVAANTKTEHKFNYDALIGTETSEGFRQAIVTITPQAGQTLTIIDFQQKHSQVGLPPYKGEWLDISVVGASISTCKIGGGNITQSALKNVSFVGTLSVTDFSYFFQNCYSLVSFSGLNTSLGTTFKYMFSSCMSLQSVSGLDTSLGTEFYSMFFNCYSLQNISGLDTSSGTNFGYMFYYCYSLHLITGLDTSLGTNFSYMFYSCWSLNNISILNTSLGTNFSYMFNNCVCLVSISGLNTSLGTNFSSMFYGCVTLHSISGLTISAAAMTTQMFANCHSLKCINSCVFSETFSIAYCMLSAAELEEVFTNLATVTAETITITGNWGAQYLTQVQKDIAINKGWTIVI